MRDQPGGFGDESGEFGRRAESRQVLDGYPLGAADFFDLGCQATAGRSADVDEVDVSVWSKVAQVAVRRPPESAAEWAEAIAAVVAGAHHPDVKDVATYGVPADGERRPGVRVSFTDGSDIFTTVLDPR
ncbi:hypothetical protein [Micromonospora sp. RTP1Z1]|uniref:hypothetical protein n=1 Tax=Micromonospora sp. RTP1Z1 TaxID=2994043 RepID=UPI0029C6CBE8|nr:hypothetical protein [Micromonospora sp. RTP1Z1]